MMTGFQLQTGACAFRQQKCRSSLRGGIHGCDITGHGAMPVINQMGSVIGGPRFNTSPRVSSARNAGMSLLRSKLTLWNALQAESE